jgi:hypothetical protein
MLGTVEIAVGDVRELFARDDREEVPPAAHLPEVHEGSDDLAPVPEIEGVRVELAHLVRMARDRYRLAGSDLAQDFDRVAVGREVFVEAEREDVDGGVAVNRVARYLRAGDHEHPVGPPGALGLAADLVEVALPCLRIQGMADRVRDTAQAVVPVDDVVGDSDDVVAAPAEEIHDLRKRQVAVRVGRVHVKVAEQHLCHPA